MSSYRFLDMTTTPLLSAAISNTDVVTTQAIKAVDFETFCFQAQWTGTLSGTIVILGSLDGENFLQFGVSIPAQPAGSAGGVLIPLFGHGMKFLQLQFTPASGSGNFVVTALGKTR